MPRVIRLLLRRVPGIGSRSSTVKIAPAMPPSDMTLDALRREIDEIDDALHDLLMRRAAVSEQVRAAKQDGSAAVFRPGREAAIIRRLVARHAGALPADVVVQVWREIIAASIRLQAAFRVAVYTPSAAPHALDLARAQFGVLTPLLPMGSVGAVLSALAEGHAQAALLPLPEETPSEPWWRGFATGGPGEAIHILARLPFAATSLQPAALVVGRQPFEPTGEDRGYLVVETGREISRARLAKTLASCGVRPLGFPAEAGGAFLVETEEHVGAGDPRLAALAEQAAEGIAAVRPIGGYAVPLLLDAARTQK